MKCPTCTNPLKKNICHNCGFGRVTDAYRRQTKAVVGHFVRLFTVDPNQEKMREIAKGVFENK